MGGYTYEQAKRVSRLQYDVDRITLINRMESLPFFVSRLSIIGKDYRGGGGGGGGGDGGRGTHVRTGQEAGPTIV